MLCVRPNNIDLYGLPRGRCEFCPDCPGFVTVCNLVICAYCGCPPTKHRYRGSSVGSSSIRPSLDISEDVFRHAFFRAAENGDSRLVERLVKYVNKDTQDDNGYSGLHWACDLGWEEVVKSLLEAGANVNLRDADDNSCLHWASDKGHSQIVFMLLCRKEIQINTFNLDLVPPLIVAAKGGHTWTVELLGRDKRTNLNFTDNHDYTALHAAVAYEGGHLEVVRVLLANLRVDRSLRAKGETAEMMAKKAGLTKIAAQFIMMAEWSSEDTLTQQQRKPRWKKVGGNMDFFRPVKLRANGISCKQCQRSFHTRLALNLHLEEHQTKNPAVSDDEEVEENDMVSTSEAEEAGDIREVVIEEEDQRGSVSLCGRRRSLRPISVTVITLDSEDEAAPVAPPKKRARVDTGIKNCCSEPPEVICMKDDED